MAATATRIRLTRFTEADGSTSHRYETDTHRFIATCDDDVWKIDIWTIKQVGTALPALMVRDRHIGTLYSAYLSDARINISDWIARNN